MARVVASMFTPASDVLAAAVAKMRKDAGLTQRQLADALGREQNLVARIETSQRRIDLVEWVSICRACGTDPEVEITRLVRAIVGLVPQKRRRGKTA
jgi:transcriptional regulator with XRE-family HTH domain